jgi:hypothetical protein
VKAATSRWYAAMCANADPRCADTPAVVAFARGLGAQTEEPKSGDRVANAVDVHAESVGQLSDLLARALPCRAAVRVGR